MLFRVKQTIEEYQLFEKGDRILIGVSGGSDSIALLSLLHKMAEVERWELHVAHVEHGLRGEESIADAEFVRDFSKRLGVSFHMGQPEVKKYAKEIGISKQVAARELRYQFFEQTAQRIGATKVALAHHADDQAETVLMRILRGTSVSGLSGIPIRRPGKGYEIVRPLYSVWRDEIEKYCQREKLSYRTDSSNALTDYLRNKIRLQLIPHLQDDYNENVKRALVHLGKIAADEDAYMDEQAQKLFESMVNRKDKELISLETRRLLEVPVALQRRIITLILYYLCGHTIEWEAKHIERVVALTKHSKPSAQIHLPNGITAWREYQVIHIGMNRVAAANPETNGTTLVVPNWPDFSKEGSFEFQVPELNLEGTMELLEGAVTPEHPWEAVFDYNKIQGLAFTVRTRLKGETFHPIGMTGSKKIKELFMEARIPVQRRDRWPIWVLDGQIAWITGIRRGQVAVIEPDTQQTLRVRVNELLFNGELNPYRR